MTKAVKIVGQHILSDSHIVSDPLGSNKPQSLEVTDQWRTLPDSTTPPEDFVVTGCLEFSPWPEPLVLELVLVGAVVTLAGLPLDGEAYQILLPLLAPVLSCCGAPV